MRDLTVAQTNWDEIEAFETELIRKMTIQEKVQEYLDLMREFGDWESPLDDDYQAERAAAHITTQERLLHLDSYRKGQRFVEPQLDRLTASVVNLQSRLTVPNVLLLTRAG